MSLNLDFFQAEQEAGITCGGKQPVDEADGDGRVGLDLGHAYDKEKACHGKGKRQDKPGPETFS